MADIAHHIYTERTRNGRLVLVVVLWALVLIPLLWGIYQTLLGVVALFTG